MICTCKKIAFNDFKNLSYWENKKITTDEDIIVKYLCKKILSNTYSVVVIIDYYNTICILEYNWLTQ